MEGDVLEETNLKTNGHDLAEVGRSCEVLAACAQVSQTEVAGSGKFETCGDDGRIKVEDGAELNL